MKEACEEILINGSEEELNEYKEYAKNNNIWSKNKGAMIKKVAEKEVCRLVEGITGIYIPEEMPNGYDLETSQTTQKRREAAKEKRI